MVTARAVAALPVLAEYGLPLCRVGGALLAPKKGDIAQEVARPRGRCRCSVAARPRRLPFGCRATTRNRQVFVLPKVRATPPGYPRRVGLPDKKPLGT